jgi:hypothetical protein
MGRVVTGSMKKRKSVGKKIRKSGRTRVSVGIFVFGGLVRRIPIPT